jgi:hypothetical protein
MLSRFQGSGSPPTPELRARPHATQSVPAVVPSAVKKTVQEALDQVRNFCVNRDVSEV